MLVLSNVEFDARSSHCIAFARSRISAISRSLKKFLLTCWNRRLFLRVWKRDLELFLYDSKIFDKLRRLFQLSWCSWSVVIAMSNRELEMIDACCLKCQWEIERLKLIAVRCELLVCEDDLLLNSSCDSSSLSSLSRLNDTW